MLIAGKDSNHNQRVEEMTLGQAAIAITVELLTETGDGKIEWEQRPSSILVKPNQGFEATLYDQGDELMISAERWHTHFDDPEEAAWCMRWLMTPLTRIVHELKGGILAAVWVERYSEDGWEPFDPAYFLNPEYPPDWVLEPGQNWYRRTIHQAALPLPMEVEDLELVNGLPPVWTQEVVTVQVQESLGLSLFEPES